MSKPGKPIPPRPTASEDEIRLERLRQRRRNFALWRLIWANLRDDARILRQAWFPLVCLLLVLAGGTTYILFAYAPSTGSKDLEDPTAAFYEVLQLLVFQSGLRLPADPLGRLLFFTVPLLGLFFLLQSVIDFGRLIFDKSASPEAWQSSLAITFSDHVIVCGLGRVGYRTVLQLLDAGYEVVVIENNWQSEFVATVLRIKVPVIRGDARDPDVQRQAGLLRARGLIAAINDDLKNIETALTARRRRPDLPTILRIFNRELDTNLERRFGRNSAFSSSALAAPTFAAAAVSRSIVHVFNLPEGMLGISEITIADESKLSGFIHGIEEHYSVRVLRHRDSGGRERRIGFMQKLAAGDIVLLIGALEALERVRLDNVAGNKLSFLERAELQHPTTQFNTVIVCGLGKVGRQVVRLLRTSRPQLAIVVICMSETPQRITDELEADGVRVVRGDASDASVLEEAGLAQAYAVAALVSQDLINLQIGLAARGMRPDIHLVLRVFSDVLAERLDALFGINTAYSTSALAAPTMAAAAVLREIDHALDVGERLFASRTIQVRPGEGLDGRRVGELRDHSEALVLALRRAGRSLILPDRDTCFQAGDEVVVLADIANQVR